MLNENDAKTLIKKMQNIKKIFERGKIMRKFQLRDANK